MNIDGLVISEGGTSVPPPLVGKLIFKLALPSGGGADTPLHSMEEKVLSLYIVICERHGWVADDITTVNAVKPGVSQIHLTYCYWKKNLSYYC